jgi:hypothetical protein
MKALSPTCLILLRCAATHLLSAGFSGHALNPTLPYPTPVTNTLNLHYPTLATEALRPTHLILLRCAVTQ